MNVRKVPAALIAGFLMLAPVSVLAAQTQTMVGNYIMTGNLTVNGLAAGVGHCAGIGTNGLLVDTISMCGGSTVPTQVAQVTTSSSSPWTATFTFGAPYSSPPICIATCFSSGPIATVATIVSESATNVTIFDSSHSGATFNVSCTHA